MFWFAGLVGEEADPVLYEAGDNAAFSWKLPDTDITILTVAKDDFTQVLFFGSTSTNGGITMAKQYESRLEVLGLYTGSVRFNLKNVTPSDAGRYVCIAGLGDVQLSDCGQMLIIVGKEKPLEVCPFHQNLGNYRIMRTLKS